MVLLLYASVKQSFSHNSPSIRDIFISAIQIYWVELKGINTELFELINEPQISSSRIEKLSAFTSD